MKAIALVLTSSAALLIQTAAFADARAASVQQVQARAENVRNQQASTSKVSVSSTGGSSLTLRASTNRDDGVRVRAIRVGGDRWGFGRTTTKTWEPGGDPFVTKRTTQWAWAAGRLGKASGSREYSTKEVAHGGPTGSAFLQTSQSERSKTTLSKQTTTKTSAKTLTWHDMGSTNTRNDSVSDTRSGTSHTTVASSSHTKGMDTTSSKVTLSSTDNSRKTAVKVETTGVQ